MAFYLDTSAFLKLVVREPESASLRRWIRRAEPAFVSSELLRTESLRAARRHSAVALRRARADLDAVTLISVTSDVCSRAADLDPGILRTLDAIHLATGLLLGDDLEALVTYDDRLAEAAALHGIAVLAPA